jgi:hypothetical protein
MKTSQALADAGEDLVDDLPTIEDFLTDGETN